MFFVDGCWQILVGPGKLCLIRNISIQFIDLLVFQTANWFIIFINNDQMSNYKIKSVVYLNLLFAVRLSSLVWTNQEPSMVWKLYSVNNSSQRRPWHSINIHDAFNCVQIFFPTAAVAAERCCGHRLILAFGCTEIIHEFPLRRSTELSTNTRKTCYIATCISHDSLQSYFVIAWGVMSSSFSLSSELNSR